MIAIKLGYLLVHLRSGPRGQQAIDEVRAAEAAGYDSVWVNESYGSDAVSMLGWLAPQTSEIGLGAAIMPAPARPPTAAAMAGATLDELSGGRFIFGFGPDRSAGLRGLVRRPLPEALGAGPRVRGDRPRGDPPRGPARALGPALHAAAAAATATAAARARR